ncbi:TonB-dependent receptor [Rufibacter psychrotolerans]|uniref:TonB-dependent receptor n=1 Tax=Rufibacter psychrotolerans TaxID=2812556 RepID=UPI0019674798|nr:TonB-dependent receptor [Rufibacter sp. SYSU D00308]
MGLLFSLPFMAAAQSLITLEGEVTDLQAAPIGGASIRLLNTNIQTVTQANGSFVLENVPAGEYQFFVSALGHAAVNRKMTVKADAVLHFQLPATLHQLEAVVISAQKQEEDPQETALSISTLSARQIQEARIWNTRDLTGIIPNLFSGHSGDNRNVTSIRGIATTSYDPTVATYIDGVNQFNLDTYIAQLHDIERIEVLRGPQGTLYGRNSMGGVINIITRQPDNTTRGFAEVNVGNYNLQRYSLGISTPLVQDKLFLGVSSLFHTREGYYQNTFTNTSFDDQQTWVGNVSLVYKPSSRLSFRLNAKKNVVSNEGAFPLESSVEEALSNPFELSQNSTATMKDNTFNGSLVVDYFGDKVNFTSQTSYQNNHRFYNQPLDGDFSPVDAVSIFNNYGDRWNNVKVGIQEFRFSTPALSSSKLQWVAGAYGFWQYNPVKQGTFFGEDAGLMGAPANTQSIATNTLRSHGAALFGQATYTLGTAFDVVLGARYDYEKKRQRVKGEFRPGEGEELILTQEEMAASASFKAFSPKLGLVFKPSINQSAFVSYSKGFRAGGLSQLSSDPSQPPLFAYKPEFSNNFEVGLKNTFLDNRVRVNLAAFYVWVNNAQVPTLVLPDAITVTKNAGKLESKGAEAEVFIKALKGLDVMYSFGYTSATYKTLDVASNGSEVNLSGNRQIYTPNITSLLALQYWLPMPGLTNAKVGLRGEWNHLGEQYFDLANQIRQNPYHKFNARVGVATPRFEAFLWGNNLSDQHYLDYAYDFGAAHLGDPRTYGLSLRANF